MISKYEMRSEKLVSSVIHQEEKSGFGYNNESTGQSSAGSSEEGCCSVFGGEQHTGPASQGVCGRAVLC